MEQPYNNGQQASPQQNPAQAANQSAVQQTAPQNLTQAGGPVTQQPSHAQMMNQNAVQQQPAQEQVVAVRKNGDGDIVELKLTSGRVVDYKTAQSMAKNNEIENVQVFRGRDDEEHLRSTPDGRKDNNLDNLPTF